MEPYTLPALATAPTTQPVAVLAVGCGDTRASVLEAAGYRVDQAGWIAFDQLAGSDLLVLAPAPPEPPAHALVRELRLRSGTPVLVLAHRSTGFDRAAIVAAGADGCLDAEVDDARLLACVRQLLATSAGERRAAAGAAGRRGLGAGMAPAS